MRLLSRIALKTLLALDAPRRLQRLLDMNESLPAFANTPAHLKIDRPFKVCNPKAIFVGDHVRLGPGCVLNPLTQYPGVWLSADTTDEDQQTFNPTLRIGNGVVSSGRLQIYVQQEVEIGDNVMFASNVFINDASHGYLTAEIPYKDQPLSQIKPVRIAEGCWIGQNVVILPGVTIGPQAIVGANSVVTRDVRARCIVAGSPARTMKVWDSGKQAWLDSKHR